MNATSTRVTGRAAAMRAAFDRGFADPLRIDATVKEELLAIRVGDEACAIRLSEIAGLFADKKITRLPGGDVALLGIAGFRGAIVPAYSLGVLLGHSVTAPPRWLVMAAGAPIALAFEAFEGQLRVSPDMIVPRQARAEARNHSREFVQAQNVVRPIMHLPSILDAIKMRRHQAEPAKEH